jgi:hypothetical protein
MESPYHDTDGQPAYPASVFYGAITARIAATAATAEATQARRAARK